ncbi:MAG: c-type cytochrome [Thermodesulfobacteriota bacterium]
MGNTSKFKEITIGALIVAWLVFAGMQGFGLIPTVVSARAQSPVEKGMALFKETGCGNCHYTDSRETKIGPGLAGLFGRNALPESGEPVSEASVRVQIKTPYDRMPAFGDRLSDAQIDLIIQYLKTL